MSENTTKMLTYAIFNKPEAALDEIENEFLKLHKKEFKEYKRDYASQVRLSVNSKKLKGSSYLDIYKDYCRRVHIHTVIAGIRRGYETAKKYHSTITAFGWFKEHINFYHQQRLSEIYRENLLPVEGVKIDLPFFFNIYKAIKSGQLKGVEFDPWCGCRVLEVENPLLVQLSILRNERSQLYHEVMKLQNKRSRTELEEEALEKWRALYNNCIGEINYLEQEIENGDQEENG